MSSTLIISVIVGMILISILISAVSYTRQQAMAKRKARIKKHRDKTNEMIGFVHILANMDEEYDLITLIQHQVIAELKAAVDLLRDDISLTNFLETEKRRLKKFQAKERDNEVRPYCSSDAELNQTRLCE